MKRILFTLAITLGMVLPSFANIASGSCGTYTFWVLDDYGCLTISGNGEMEDHGNGFSPWYSNRTSITSVTIGRGVTNIGNSAFYGCSALTKITIPNTVTKIGKSAFESCSALTSITIPNSVTSIGTTAFANCI